jgi:glycerol-3-phosphate dehydrogenase subunit C
MKIDPHPPLPPASTPRDARYWDAGDLERELRRVFEICHGCRMCVNYCGSFPDLFARVDRDIESKGAAGAERLDAADFASVTELCWQCKLCYIKCPYTADEGHDWLVDVPALLTREKAQRAQRNGVTLQDQALGEPQALGALGSGPLAPLMNFVNANRLVRKVNERVLGISSEFPLPTFASRTFERWLDHHVPLDRAGTNGTVALFSTCTGDYNYPAVPANAVRVLEHNGFAVVRPQQTCCGMPNLDGGDMDAFLAKARANVESLLREVEEGRDIVVAQPTCSYTLKREYPTMLGTDEAREVAAHTFDLMEFLDRLRRQKKLDTEFKKGLGRVAYHAPCHMRAQKFGAPGARLLALLPETKVEVVEQCSAVDGTWGMKAQYYEMGRRYARKLRDRVESAAPDLVVSDCSLAALRIQKENGVRVMHPIESLADGYGIAVAVSGG